MLNVSDTWTTVAAGDHARIYRFTVDGRSTPFEAAEVVSAEFVRGLFGASISTGNTQSAELVLALLPASSVTIPRGAAVVAECALSLDGVTAATEWLPQGTYYVNGRKTDRITGVITLTCYDRMFAGNGIFEPGGVGSYPMGLSAAVAQCATVLGVEYDARSDNLGADALLTIPDETTAQTLAVVDVLRLAGICSAGNFVITAENKLRFLALSSISGGLISSSVLATEDGLAIRTEAGDILLISKLIATNSSEQNVDMVDLGHSVDVADDLGEFQVTAARIYTSGRSYIETTYEDQTLNTGYTLTANVSDFPALVDAPGAAAVYGALVDCAFQAIDVDSAIWDPRAECGDFLTVAGMTSTVSEVVISAGPITIADISTPGIGETLGEIMFRAPKEG